jgi:hypothetical protein
VVVMPKKRSEPIVRDVWLVISQERKPKSNGHWDLNYECICETEAEAIAAAPNFGSQCYVLPVKEIYTLPV